MDDRHQAVKPQSVDVPSGYSRPNSATPVPKPHAIHGTLRPSRQAPLGTSLLSTDGTRAVEEHTATGRGGASPSPPAAATTDTAVAPSQSPLSDFVERVGARIASAATHRSATASSPLQHPTQLSSHTSSRTQTPASNSRYRPVSRLRRSTSETRAASRGSGRGHVNCVALEPLPSMCEDDMSTGPHAHQSRSGVSSAVPLPRSHAVPTGPCTPHTWIDSKMPALLQAATPVSPVVSAHYAGIPRTLADRAIRWKGVRAASALARAFEAAMPADKILEQASIRMATKLM